MEIDNQGEVTETGSPDNQAVSSEGTVSVDIEVAGKNEPGSDGRKVAEKSEPGKGLSLCQKLCYAVGGAPYQITASALGFFLQIFLLDVAELNPFHASIIVFAGRAWDAITDPTVGFLVSRSPWTPFGRMLTWMVTSAPFAVVAYFLVWYVPPFVTGRVYWYVVFYCLFETLETCFHVPYSALTMFISTEQKDRDSCSAYRMTVEVLGMMIGTAIQGQIVGMASAPCIPVDLGEGLDNSTQLLATHSTGPPTKLEDTKFAYMMASLAINAIYGLCAVVLFMGVKEKRETVHPRSEPISFAQAIRMVMGYGPYAILNMACLCTATGYYLLEGNFAVFCTYTLGFRDQFQNVLLVCMISAAVSVPFWHWVLSKFGKKTAFYAGNLFAIPTVILLVLVGKNLYLTYILSFACGMSISAAMLIPWSMLPDVVDDFKVHNPDSVGHEAIFYSFYVFFGKFAAGISMGISTLALYFAGYHTRGCSQPDEVNLTLNVLVSAMPIFLILIGLVIFYYYPINEETRTGNSKLLQELQDSKPEMKWTQEIQEDAANLA